MTLKDLPNQRLFLVKSCGVTDWLSIVQAPNASEACTMTIEDIFKKHRADKIDIGLTLTATDITDAPSVLKDQVSGEGVFPTFMHLADAGMYHAAETFEKLYDRTYNKNMKTDDGEEMGAGVPK